MRMFVSRGQKASPVTSRSRLVRLPGQPAGVRMSVLVTACLALAWPPAAALGQAPSGPPGPPPGGGAELPRPPGTAPAYVPPGTPATIPGDAKGPGLLSGRPARLDRAKRRFSLPLACQAGGTVRVTASPAIAGTLARGRYHCAGGRATVKLTVAPKLAGQVVRRGAVVATARVRQGGTTATLPFELRARGAAAEHGFWTDGHLQCSPDGGGSQAYLSEPDFTANSPVPISTRGWVAWYSAGAGWHWLGVGGENAGRWDTWTATPAGVAQFHPNGFVVPVPWTWGPISVPTGRGIHAVGVYEIVYWVGGRPEYRWQYVNAGVTGAAAAGGGTLYCVYP
jgi:hypothetical protein